MSTHRLHELIGGSMKLVQLTDVQKIFALSKVYGTNNRQDLLPHNGWTWPKQTWLTKRLDEIKKEQSDDSK